MNSRIKKQPKSYENYEKIIEKHLKDDFDVHEYLSQNNLTGDNMGDYSKLFNSMLVTKNQKRKKYDSLKVNYDQMVYQKVDVWTEALLLEMLQEKNYKFSQTYQQIATKLSFQSKVQDAIHKQIIEIKNSINLIKGDIGHLVDRNESAKLLQSKISKVKIVADDQLKRVSLAYLKDREEVKIRNDMQKNFNKKIKNATIHQDSTLKRLKKTYIDTIVRKKQIHDRLSEIQKVNASINASGEKQRQMNGKRRKLLSLFQYFNKLSDLIEQIRASEGSILSGSHNTDEFIKWFKNYVETVLFTRDQVLQEQLQPQDSIEQNSKVDSLSLRSGVRFPSDYIELQDIQNLTQSSLRQFESEIVKEFNRVTQQIDAKTCQYNSAVKRKDEIISLSDIYQHQIQKLQVNICKQASLQYILTPQIKQEYSKKMKQFSSIMKTLFAYLEYIEKKLNYSNQYSNQSNHKKFFESCSQFFVYRHSLSHMNKTLPFQALNLKLPPSEQPLKTQKGQLFIKTKHYASELYNIHCSLMADEYFDQNKFDQLTLDIHNYLQTDVKIWMNNLKDALVHGKIEKLCPPKPQSHIVNLLKLKNHARKRRDNRMSLTMSQKAARQSVQSEISQLAEQNEYHKQNYHKNRTIHHSSGDLSSKGYIIPSKSRYMKITRSVGRNLGTIKKMINSSKLDNHNETAQPSLEQAQRIQLLQNVDLDYYKMLKYTLKMEKENTRKNYLFLKNFNRTKYSSRDSILEQKRYEVSFSMRFAGKKTELTDKKSIQVDKGSKMVNKKSRFSKAASLQSRFSKHNEASGIVESNKDIKLPDLTVSQSENSMKQLRENFRCLKPNNSVHCGIQKRSRFSEDVKEILKLVV